MAVDAIHNPYAPGAGTPPPELAGRREVLEAARVALERIRIGRFAKGVMLVGLRGVGKTVLLDRMRDLAEERGMIAVRVEAPDERSLPSILAPALRSALLKLSGKRAARQLAQRALRGLASFVSALKVKYQDLEVGLDLEPEAGLADNGDLEADLPDLFEAVGAAARNDRNCVALFIDELQYVATGQLAALIAALHRTAQRQVPVALVGAGLPQLRGRMGKAKSYAERLFEFHEIGALPAEDASRRRRAQLINKGMIRSQSHDTWRDSDVEQPFADRVAGLPRRWDNSWGGWCRKRWTSMTRRGRRDGNAAVGIAVRGAPRHRGCTAAARR